MSKAKKIKNNFGVNLGDIVNDDMFTYEYLVKLNGSTIEDRHNNFQNTLRSIIILGMQKNFHD